MNQNRWVRLGGFVLFAAGISGCATEQALVQFSYVVEPTKKLPPGMETISIEPATLGPNTDPKWSDLSVRIIESLVHESRTRFGTPVTIADRRDTDRVFRERDMKDAGMSKGKAGTGGQLMDIQGTIASDINVKVEKSIGRDRTISGIDLSGFRGRRSGGGSVAIDTEEVETVTRTLTVQTEFRLLDAADGSVWDQYTTRHTGTEKTEASPIFGRSMTEAELTPQDQIIGTLVERGAREFVSRHMPCRIEVTEEVEASTNANCARGVQLLRAEQFEEALSLFKAARAENPNDHRAAFGAGVACEAMGRLEEAQKYYNDALTGDDNPAYMEARDRVKAFVGRAKRPTS
jgi:hypothetical protein